MTSSPDSESPVWCELDVRVMWTERKEDRQTDRGTDRWRGGQIDRQTDRRTDRSRDAGRHSGGDVVKHTTGGR